MLKYLKQKPLPKFRMCLRISKEDMKVFSLKARQYTAGNVSEWLRYAAINHMPPKSQVVRQPPRKKKA